MELHLSPKTIGRGQGRQVVAAAAYRSGEKLYDARTGQTWDFSRRGGVAYCEIIAPAGAVPWATDRQQLWNEAEKAEDKSTRRDTARTAREFEVSLPHQLSETDRHALGLEFTRWLVDRYGFVADVAFHDPHGHNDDRNFHMHILTTTRVMSDAGFGGKVRALDFGKTASPEILAVRETFATMANAYLDRAGVAERVEHLSFEERGLNREATQHLGPDASAMERDGEATRIGDKNRAVADRNAEREALEATASAVAGEIAEITALRAEKMEDRADRAAVRTFEPAAILEQITARKATFTRADLNYLLSKHIPDATERGAMNSAILGRPEVIGLRDEANGPVARFTTRAVLEAERDVLSDSARLAADTSHGLTDREKAEALDRHSHLDREQRGAFDHATGPEALALIAGEAGTGKSATIAAIRDAYEDAGHRVVGLSWTNSVVEDMRQDGFNNAATVVSELYRLDHGMTVWNQDTVVIVDEAAMLSTKHLAAVAAKAEDSGAKLILAGDDRQLASIERGGLFGALRDSHGAAELHSVRRVVGEDQKTAFNMMHRGEFKPALDLFERRGAIHWQDSAEASRAALVGQYRKDIDADPAKSRFVFAYTNAEVAELNRDLRAMQRERGALAEDHSLPTTDGPQNFAVGDKVQFTANGRSRAEKAQGLVNGAVGTVEAIDGQRMVIALDRDSGKRRTIALIVGTNAEAGEFGGIRHGYAGTIYKGQGKTLDQTYLIHSKHWRESSSYVALSRHREEARVFVGKDTARDLDQLARQMSRTEERRAASQFVATLTPEQRREDTGRAFDKAAEAVSKPPGRPTDAKAAPEAPKVPEERDAAYTARKLADASKSANAQRKAALIGKIKDPVRQARALARFHSFEQASRGATSLDAQRQRDQKATERPLTGAERRAADLANVEAAYAALKAERPREYGYQLERTRGRTR